MKNKFLEMSEKFLSCVIAKLSLLKQSHLLFELSRLLRRFATRNDNSFIFQIILLLNLIFYTSLCAQDTLSTAFKDEIAASKTLLVEEQQQGSYALFGAVVDQITKEPIGKAKVSMLGTKFIVTTLADGQYKFTSIPEGVYQIKAEADGYEPQILNNVYISETFPREIKNFALRKIQQGGQPADFVPVEKMPQPLKDGFVAPQYPEEARKNKIEGIVWVKIWVNEQGEPQKAIILKTDNEIFNQASTDAAMKWKFSPAMLHGKPVSVWISIPFKFKLDPCVNSEDLDTQPAPIKKEFPKYPDKAKKLNLQGEFWLGATIDEKGNVAEALCTRFRVTDNKTIDDTQLENIKQKSEEIYAAVKLMTDEAVNVIKQWKFSPGMKNGKPVRTKIIVPIKYALDEKKK